MTKIVAVVLGVLMLSGCADAEQASAKDAAQAFVDALGSPDKACALLAPRARDLLGAAGCGTLSSLPRGPVESVSVWGGEAQSRTSGDVLFLHAFSAGWLVTGAGCHPRNEQVYDCLVGGR